MKSFKLILALILACHFCPLITVAMEFADSQPNFVNAYFSGLFASVIVSLIFLLFYTIVWLFNSSKPDTLLNNSEPTTEFNFNLSIKIPTNDDISHITPEELQTEITETLKEILDDFYSIKPTIKVTSLQPNSEPPTTQLYTIKLSNKLQRCSFIPTILIGSSKCSSCEHHTFISDDTDDHGKRTEFTFKCNNK